LVVLVRLVDGDSGDTASGRCDRDLDPQFIQRRVGIDQQGAVVNQPVRDRTSATRNERYPGRFGKVSAADFALPGDAPEEALGEFGV
jgi:hypothetical protein